MVLPVAQAKTLLVCPSCVYTTIQSAVDASNPGDTVSVQAGSYSENVTVSTPSITLKGQKPMGSVLLDCPSSGTGVGILVSSSGVTIKGFEIEGCEIGVEASLNPDFTLAEVRSMAHLSKGGNPAAVARAQARQATKHATSDQNTVISDNTFEENAIGVLLAETGDCIVSGNDFFANTEAGIYTFYTFTDSISGNTIEGIASSSAPENVGIGIVYGQQESVKSNTVRYANYLGIGEQYTYSSTFSANRTFRNAVGLWSFTPSANNTFSKNDSDANQFWDCEDDTVGSKSKGTANTWTGNVGDTSEPPGLCKP
jgi:parallel beta-helix repeat protein